MNVFYLDFLCNGVGTFLPIAISQYATEQHKCMEQDALHHIRNGSYIMLFSKEGSDWNYIMEGTDMHWLAELWYDTKVLCDIRDVAKNNKARVVFKKTAKIKSCSKKSM